jgi:hypothetical protein
MQINGINMAVGVNGTLGKCMIRNGHGINIEVRRSLRDIFRKVPMLSMTVQVINLFPLFSAILFHFLFDHVSAYECGPCGMCIRPI